MFYFYAKDRNYLQCEVRTTEVADTFAIEVTEADGRVRTQDSLRNRRRSTSAGSNSRRSSPARAGGDRAAATDNPPNALPLQEGICRITAATRSVGDTGSTRVLTRPPEHRRLLREFIPVHGGNEDESAARAGASAFPGRSETRSRPAA